MRRQVEPLRRFFRLRVPCPADAGDLVQRTLTVSLEALPRFRGEGSFSGFVRTIAVRLLLQHRRCGQRASACLAADLQIHTLRRSWPCAYLPTSFHAPVSSFVALCVCGLVR